MKIEILKLKNSGHPLASFLDHELFYLSDFLFPNPTCRPNPYLTKRQNKIPFADQKRTSIRIIHTTHSLL